MNRMKMMFSKDRKWMFFVAYGLYVAVAILCSSKYAVFPFWEHHIFPLFRFTAYGLVCLKIFLDFLNKKYSLGEIIANSAVGTLLVISMYVTQNRDVLIFFAFIAAAHDVDFKDIIKLSLYVHIACICLVIGSCCLGILENQLYTRSSGGVRESLGFAYTTEGSNFFYYTLLMWIYWRKSKLSIWESIVLLAINIYFFIKTDTSSAFCLGLIALAGANILKYSSYLRDYKKIYSVIAVGSVPALASFIIGVSARYDSTIAWMEKLNSVVHGRISLGESGLRNFGVHLLGQRIHWVGGAPEPPLEYNYVDSSYLQSLLSFGPIVLGLILVWLVCIGIFISLRRDTYFLLVFVLMAVHTTFDPELLWIGHNSFIMTYAYIKGYGGSCVKKDPEEGPAIHEQSS